MGAVVMKTMDRKKLVETSKKIKTPILPIFFGDQRIKKGPVDAIFFTKQLLPDGGPKNKAGKGKEEKGSKGFFPIDENVKRDKPFFPLNNKAIPNRLGLFPVTRDVFVG